MAAPRPGGSFSPGRPYTGRGMPMGWDKPLTQKLVAMGIPWEKAREVVGLIAEERQLADHDGYKRGFEAGFEAGFAEAKRKLAPKTEH